MKKVVLAVFAFIIANQQVIFSQENYLHKVSTSSEKMEEGKFQPTWESLKQYEVPEWFNDVKFGIWAHWGPQCHPEQGDWYARFMYNQGSREYNWFVENFGHPSEFGFKDIINDWKAEKWDPEKLVDLYKRTGAQYFFAMGNHHDNMDLWDSKYQPWNSVKLGPKRDIIGEWAKAAKKNKLPFGVSIHSAHAWRWFESAQTSDRTGDKKGIPYDGKLTKEDGKNTWWDGLDPQDLYAQNHPLSENSEDIQSIHSQWGWNNGAVPPSEEYCTNFYERTVDVINKYDPDLLYFDDSVLPLYPVSDAGMKITAHYYNKSAKKNKGKVQTVLMAKILNDEQKKALVWDVEKGAPDQIQEQPWQSCTCIGSWHYKRSDYEQNRYKSAAEVIRLLIDIVSKNGNLLLSIPIRSDGSIDDKEIAILEEISQWMDINKESIFGTRPWKIFGEGPLVDLGNPIHAQGFNEGQIRNATSQEIRFTNKKGTLYATALSWPEDNKIVIKSLAINSQNYTDKIKKIELLGVGKVQFTRDENGLTVQLPTQKLNNIAPVLKISK